MLSPSEKRNVLFCMVVIILLAAASCGSLDEAQIEREIMAVMDASEAGWNSGDLVTYMQCYLESDSMRFGGNGSVTYGWQQVLERYQKKYTDRAAMGILSFSDIDITVLSTDAALVFGRWRLDKEGEQPSGLYTLLFRKTPGGWKIVHDHSSSAGEE